MDRARRILSLAADWILNRPDPRAREINAAIHAKASNRLNNYPYRFRAVRVHGDTAVLTPPRNVQVPAFRFIGAIHPEINVKNPNDPAFIAAETELGLVQSEVAAIAAAQPGSSSSNGNSTSRGSPATHRGKPLQVFYLSVHLLKL